MRIRRRKHQHPPVGNMASPSTTWTYTQTRTSTHLDLKAQGVRMALHALRTVATVQQRAHPATQPPSRPPLQWVQRVLSFDQLGVLGISHLNINGLWSRRDVRASQLSYRVRDRDPTERSDCGSDNYQGWFGCLQIFRSPRDRPMWSSACERCRSYRVG